MRTFIAIDLPKEVKDYLFDLQKELKSKLPAKLSWTHKKNLHLTLKFLGDIEDIEKIKTSLKEVKFKPFTLNISELGTFSDKVFWIGISPEKSFFDLARKVDEETLSYNPEVKFKAHLTLGKIKQIKDRKEFKKVLDQIEIKNLEFEVNKFQLLASKLSKDGPKYKILEEY